MKNRSDFFSPSILKFTPLPHQRQTMLSHQIQRTKRCGCKDMLMLVFQVLPVFCSQKVPLMEAGWFIVQLLNNVFHCCFLFSVVSHPTSHSPLAFWSPEAGPVRASTLMATQHDSSTDCCK